MTRVVVLTVVALLAIVGVGVGVATAAPQAPPARVSTFSGHGATAFNVFDADGRVEVGKPGSASGYIQGSPTGTRPTVQFNGPIVCLDIRGNQVGAVYRFDSTSRPRNLNDGLYLYITGIDGGPGGVDLAGTAFPTPFPPTLGCAPNPALNNFGPVLRGDLVVHDGR